MTKFEKILELLEAARIDYILIGGLAATAFGSSRLTTDIDLIYSRTEENQRKILKMFSSLNPYLRGAPPGLPFHFDERTLSSGLNFTLKTELGDIDLLAEVPGGNYESLKNDMIELEIFGQRCKCIGLKKLIELKKASGRPKDFEAIAELEAILEENGLA
ncbi:hypothetical protein EHQ53_16065 [Leptospira langatensis]|uniref:Nucleotidyltransferase n=1 Tax=Leptospira langatensis TaxID=2484983 RepID=A0A5F1ZND4_9LEPT|nr:hypothetical protein [Leptospira langatensis]TGK05158.1 hypothetical protein EHO57_00305 [Leptospira langatensis]TGL38295.1 hypothetical protein EHQ53_16065 [Leptospira langatensis]